MLIGSIKVTGEILLIYQATENGTGEIFAGVLERYEHIKEVS